MTKIILAAIMVAAPFASAQAMTVATFLAKMDGLQKKAPMALFSSDVGLLKNEGKAVGEALRQEPDLAVKAGRKSDYCPPAKAAVRSTHKIEPNEFMTHLRTIPVAERGMSIKTAMATLLKKKYPCPA